MMDARNGTYSVELQTDPGFLLVTLQLDDVLGRGNPKEMIKALNSLSSDLPKAYKRIIDRMDPGQKEFAFQILSWILHARRHLRMEELCEALAVEDGQKKIVDVAISPPNYIIETCAGLVIYDEDTKIVRFNHQTVKEFLEVQNSVRLLEPIALAKTCLTYLGFNEFDVPCYDERSLQDRLERYKFSRYAAQYWAEHVRGAAERENVIQNAILETFQSVGKRESMCQCQKYAKTSSGTFGKVKGSSLLHIIAENGLATVCGSLLDETSNENDTYIWNLLVTDGSRGLQRDVDVTDDSGATPLHRAALNGHLEVVKVLVSKKADVAAMDNWGRAALYYAAGSGHLEVMKVLVDNNADVAATDNYGRTALHYASRDGHLKVVKALVVNNVAANDKDGRTALHYAAENGHLDVVKMLLDNKADITARANNRRTALHYAALNGHLDVVKMLLVNKTDITARANNGRTALHYAALNGHLEVVKVLVDNNADIFSLKDVQGRQALDLAKKYSWNEEVAKWLSEHPLSGRETS